MAKFIRNFLNRIIGKTTQTAEQPRETQLRISQFAGPASSLGTNEGAGSSTVSERHVPPGISPISIDAPVELPDVVDESNGCMGEGPTSTSASSSSSTKPIFCTANMRKPGAASLVKALPSLTCQFGEFCGENSQVCESTQIPTYAQGHRGTSASTSTAPLQDSDSEEIPELAQKRTSTTLKPAARAAKETEMIRHAEERQNMISEDQLALRCRDDRKRLVKKTLQLCESGGFQLGKCQFYQHQIHALLNYENFLKRIYAWAMGAGKSMFGISLFCHYFGKCKQDKMKPKPCILIVPVATIIDVWQKEFEKFSPNCNVTYITSMADAEACRTGDLRGIYVMKETVLVALFKLAHRWDPKFERVFNERGRRVNRGGYAKMSHSQFFETAFYFVGIDEGHKARNYNIAIPKLWYGAACRAICSNALRAFLLTGTPVVNRAGDLSGLLLALGERGKFNDPKVWRVDADSNSIDMNVCQDARNLFIDRVSESELQKTVCLPPKNVVVHEYIHEPSLKFLEWLREANTIPLATDGDEYISQGAFIRYGELLTKMKLAELHPALVHKYGGRKFNRTCVNQALKTPSPALLHAASCIQMLLGSHDKIVVAGSFVTFLTLLQRWCHENHSIDGNIYDGSCSMTKRSSILRNFACPDGKRVLYLSSQAGGVGLSLVSGSAMLIVDHMYSLNDQLIHRVYRRGQKGNASGVVDILHLAAKDGIQAAVQKAERGKQKLAEIMLDSDETGVVTWREISRISLEAYQEVYQEAYGQQPTENATEQSLSDLGKRPKSALRESQGRSPKRARFEARLAPEDSPDCGELSFEDDSMLFDPGTRKHFGEMKNETKVQKTSNPKLAKATFPTLHEAIDCVNLSDDSEGQVPLSSGDDENEITGNDWCNDIVIDLISSSEDELED